MGAAAPFPQTIDADGPIAITNDAAQPSRDAGLLQKRSSEPLSQVLGWRHRGTVEKPEVASNIGVDANCTITLLLRQHFEIGVSGTPVFLFQRFDVRLRIGYATNTGCGQRTVVVRRQDIGRGPKSFKKEHSLRPHPDIVSFIAASGRRQQAASTNDGEVARPSRRIGQTGQYLVGQEQITTFKAERVDTTPGQVRRIIGREKRDGSSKGIQSQPLQDSAKPATRRFIAGAAYRTSCCIPRRRGQAADVQISVRPSAWMKVSARLGAWSRPPQVGREDSRQSGSVPSARTAIHSKRQLAVS